MAAAVSLSLFRLMEWMRDAVGGIDQSKRARKFGLFSREPLDVKVK